jgi:16S rRNA (cytosine1402-N4)-methyltransferase
MHYPVLWREVLEYLAPRPGNIILDATLGGGGHSLKIAGKIGPGGKLIALDRDPEAIARVREKAGDVKGLIRFVNEDFRRTGDVLEELAPDGVDGSLFDLGLSSYQLDSPERGFSCMSEGPLDMRFDRSMPVTAEDIVNDMPRKQLADIIYRYGEERGSRAIASAVCRERNKARISTTSQLADLIKRAVGRRYRNQKLHPAVRTFQALRIYVNDELGALSEGLEGAIQRTRPGGRICVISFHSLEDRIAKRIFRSHAREGGLRILTRKPLRPSGEEVKENRRSRSAKLRVAEKAENETA